MKMTTRLGSTGGSEPLLVKFADAPIHRRHFEAGGLPESGASSPFLEGGGHIMLGGPQDQLGIPPMTLWHDGMVGCRLS